MSGNRDETVRQFCDVTGADEARSKFFLESSNWQLEEAISSFYEHGGNIDEGVPMPQPTPVPASLSTMSDSDMESPPESPQRPKKGKKKSNTKFATLDSLQKEESSSDEEEGQAFYAGGSERSGQQILGPSRGRKDIVTEVFKSVKERGAVVFEDEPSSTSRGRGGVFGGVGYRLGQTDDDHEPVTPAAGPQSNQPRSVRLRLYREGFSVDSGPLRSYTDPAHADFLNHIRRGEIPPELGGGGEVRVSLEDRRHDDIPPNSARAQPFAGKGHLLGSPTPNVVGEAPPAGAAGGPAAGDVTDDEARRRAAQDSVTLDDSQPTTTVQFRLADGRRVAGRFNHSHTVGDLVRFVSLAAGNSQFALLSSFPTRELTDASASLAAADLLNSTLLQRLK